MRKEEEKGEEIVSLLIRQVHKQVYHTGNGLN